MNKPSPEVHPIARLLPWMTPDQEQELRLDMRKNGLRTPIVMYEGKILDGRHRSNIWYDIHHNHDFPSTVFEGTHAEAVDLVRSLNVKRRHLKRGQMAAFEAEAEAYLKPQRTGGDQRSIKARSDHGGNSPMKSQRKIAAAAGVDRKTIRKAAEVIKNAVPIVTMTLREGKISVERALAISRMPKAKQLDALDGTIKVPKPRRRHARGSAAPSLEVVSERDPEVVAFNRGIEAAAQLVDDEGYDALAHAIRELME